MDLASCYWFMYSHQEVLPSQWSLSKTRATPNTISSLRTRIQQLLFLRAMTSRFYRLSIFLHGEDQWTNKFSDLSSISHVCEEAFLRSNMSNISQVDYTWRLY